jgi:hypothetical protein
MKNADTALANGCDDECLKGNLCYMATAKTGDTTQCDTLMQEYEAGYSSGSSIISTITQYLMSFLSG